MKPHARPNIYIHVVVEEDDPGQEEPPFLAVGLLQDLNLCLLPVPELHEPQDPQDPQLPLTRPTKGKN